MSQAYLFVYGTLRRGAETRMYRLLAQHSDFVGEASWKGRLYKVDYYPGAVPSDDPAHRVKGEVYVLREPASILAALDVYEDCGPGSAEPAEYVRSRQEVILGNGQRLTAWVYVYQRPTTGLTEIVSGDFLRTE